MASSSDGGDDPFACAFCLSTCVDPCTSSCGQHSYCLTCFADYITREAARGVAPLCPECRQPCQTDPASLRVNVRERELIQALQAAQARARAAPPPPPPTAQIPWAELVFDKDRAGERVELGEPGGSATVYSASYHFQPVAVKQLRHVTPPMLAALAREAALQSSISHDAVVRVYGLASDTASNPDRPRHALVMARMWRSLHSVLADPAATPASLPFAWRLHALHQATQGLAHLHARRVAHGDLKPANILLTPPAQGAALQLTDFGFARVSSAARASSGSAGAASEPSLMPSAEAAASGRGTLSWMAPELLAPAVAGKLLAPSLATDVYSWGTLAWQLLSLSPVPYPLAAAAGEAQLLAAVLGGARPQLGALPAETPPALAQLLTDCWAERGREGAGARPATAGEVLGRLQAAAPDPGPSMPPLLTPRLPTPPVQYAVKLTPWLPRAEVGGGGGAAAACEVCEVPATAACPLLQLGCAPGHSLCMLCALRTFRRELTPDAPGLMCPMCKASPAAAAAAAAAAGPREGGSDEGGVAVGGLGGAAYITPQAFMELAAWSRSESREAAATAAGVAEGGEGALELRPASDEEVQRFEAISARAAAAAAARAMGHMLRPCPVCGTGVSKPRGHHCHHIAPNVGCTGMRLVVGGGSSSYQRCGTHFCYSCGIEHLPGASHNTCPTPGCKLFCSNTCLCPDCPDCSPGRPCADCSSDGRCWSCYPERREALRPSAAAKAYKRRAMIATMAQAAADGAGGGAAGAGAAAAAAPPATWNCLTCTLLNSTADSACRVCHAARPAAAAAGGAAGSRAEWACGSCTLLNPDSRTYCDMCHARRGAAPPPPPQQQQQPPPAASGSSTLRVPLQLVTAVNPAAAAALAALQSGSSSSSSSSSRPSPGSAGGFPVAPGVLGMFWGAYPTSSAASAASSTGPARVEQAAAAAAAGLAATRSAWHCATCGYRNPAHARACPVCGGSADAAPAAATASAGAAAATAAAAATPTTPAAAASAASAANPDPLPAALAALPAPTAAGQRAVWRDPARGLTVGTLEGVTGSSCSVRFGAGAAGLLVGCERSALAAVGGGALPSAPGQRVRIIAHLCGLHGGGEVVRAGALKKGWGMAAPGLCGTVTEVGLEEELRVASVKWDGSPFEWKGLLWELEVV